MLGDVAGAPDVGAGLKRPIGRRLDRDRHRVGAAGVDEVEQDGDAVVARGSVFERHLAGQVGLL